MANVKRVLRVVDCWQRHNRVAGVAYGVVRKFGDDDANLWVVALGWYGLTAIYPLLLVVVTIFGFIGVASLGHSVVTTLHQFPVIGSDFNPAHGSANLHGSVFALIVGVVGLLYGAQGVTQTAERALARVWNTPPIDLPGFVPRLVRSVTGLLIIGTAFVANAFFDRLVTARGHGLLLRIPLLLVMVAANIGWYFAAFWTLTPRFPHRRNLLPGAVAAGIGFTVVTTAATGLLQTQLRHTTNTYGAFASVIGVVTYLLLLAKLTLYSAELNPVLAETLWPRALPTMPPSEADNRVLRALAHEERRRPDQHVGVGFDPDAAHQAARDAQIPSDRTLHRTGTPTG